MNQNIVTDFNTPGAADAALHSLDGWIRASKVEVDTIKQEARFYAADRYLGKIVFTGQLVKGETLHILLDTGFAVRPA